MEIFVSVFVMKFMDCALSTMKTVFLCKNKFFISSVLNSLAAALFIFVANSMAMAPEDQKNWIALTVFFANLIGGYFPPKFLDRFEADKLFVYIITAENFDEGKNFADKLRELNIPVSTTVIGRSIILIFVFENAILPILIVLCKITSSKPSHP